MADGSGKASGLAALAPLLACALCPACLSLYAKLAGVVGAGLAISEAAHAALLATAMLVSVLVSAYRYRLTRRGWPVSLSLVGITLMTLAHILGGSDLPEARRNDRGSRGRVRTETSAPAVG
jgi:hypothetical protein